jgi:ABC-type oligopeptide transport system substrate-binding subunit
MLKFTSVALLILAVLIAAIAYAAAAKTKRPQLDCRDAKTGQYVTPAYAKKNPTTTVCEQRT